MSNALNDPGKSCRKLRQLLECPAPIPAVVPRNIHRCLAFWLSFSVLVAGPVNSAEIKPEDLPPPADRQIDFERDVKPIFERSCLKCHGPEKPKSRFRLDNRESALKGGSNNSDDIVPGNSAKSKLIHYVSGLDEDIVMPPSNKYDPLTSEEIGILRAWIDQGANWSTNGESKLKMSVAPTLRWIHVQGNKAKFREVEGMKEKWAGGVDHFEFREELSPEARVVAEGHALFGDENFRLQLAVEKDETGFIRAGFESWREYYDDVGGYAPLLPTNSFALDRDLHLDVGRAWIDLGLTLPDRPSVVLGYEYQFKHGDKSTLQWGPVGTLPPFAFGTDAKNVYPAFKQIDEETHIIKLDIRHELRGWQLQDNARLEFYELSTRRQNVFQHSFGATPDSVIIVSEKHQHISGANVFNATKQIREWWSVSSGYLYSRLDGDGSFEQSTVNGSGAAIFGEQWVANQINHKRESHVLSLASIIGPSAGLTLSVGGQGEWTQQESVGQQDLRFGDPSVPLIFSDASPVVGNLDSKSAREYVVARFTDIPFTVLSAEVRLKQEDLGRFEERAEGNDPFRRDTDATIQMQEYRLGVTSSPWSRLTLGAGARHRIKETDYTHHEVFHPVGFLYPGFILWRDIEEDQVDARLVYRVTSWLRTSFNYRWLRSEFGSATGPVLTLSPGGAVSAADHEAHIYSLNAVLTPWRRLYLSGTVSYSDSRTDTAQNAADYLVPWKGAIYSVASSVTYALTDAANLRANYAYTKSDYGQGNAQTGLPAGIDYERHAVQLALSRRFASHLVATLGYGFYQYREPTLGGAADYRAHAVFATATIPWP